MKIAITGHTNIEKAHSVNLLHPNGEIYNKEALEKTYNEILIGLHNFCIINDTPFNELTLISGMARGVDEIFAILAIKNSLKLILSIPSNISWHRTRGLSRNMRAQAIFYDDILNYSNIISIYEVNKDYNGLNFPLVNLARNQQMVDIADFVFSYKAYNSTGTDDCISRAKIKNKYAGNLKSEIKQFEQW